MPTDLDAPTTWSLRTLDEEAVRHLVRQRGLPEPVARVLVARGLCEPEAVDKHLQPSLMALHDPGRLPDMQAAARRLVAAVRAGETILVHGDYDVDGVTGTALLVRLFHTLGADVAWHIPNRFTDGYAFGAHSVAKALEVGAKVVVSVDNGTSSRETITELLEHGIETIVTDHHEPPLGELPPATAIVNPKLATSEYPFRELCGGAVAFKLAWGICQELSGGGKVRDDLKAFLVDAMGYVAIATVCDVVPLVDENRILARYGLKSLEATQHPGLAALLRVAGLVGLRLGGDDVGFQIGPRLNASGRLGTAQTAVELLMCDDAARARDLATQLDQLNVERKRIEAELVEQAVAQAERYANAEHHPVLVVAGQGWHQGVIGIVAARLVDRYQRPAIVIGLDGDHGRGSARTVEGVSILELLHAAQDVLPKYGGHAQAAGMDVAAADVDALRALVNAAAKERHADGLPDAPLVIDGELAFEGMGEELMRQLERLEPHGERNEAPVFLSRDLRLAQPPRVVGADGTHLILQLRRGDRVLKGMAFKMAARAKELAMGRPLDVVYSPRWNTFRGQTNLEVLVHDFRCGE
ncbi:MAG: single-stranded-DNA-specific exonuclease RecJ [Planctomycetes bacterium]|nr:single-stranded-DNA-specific exonuclease RecJ [Planctomycetota bacterium]